MTAAIALLTKLLTVATLGFKAVESAQKLSELMKVAADEGRDLTPEELEPFIEERKEAEASWDNRE